jgi:osmoprotectant transport system permease protein
VTPLGAALRPAALGVALAVLATAPVASAAWGALGGAGRAYPTERLLGLAGSHAAVALPGAALGALAGFALGLAVTRPAGRALRPLADALVAAAQAVPPVVVVALAFPVLGFGAAPTLLALLLYAVMPVLRGTVAALDSVPPDARNAAEALGFSPARTLREVELPLAAPVVLAALRVALATAVGTAAVGALAGAETLGTPIVLGLQNQNQLLVLQGAAATAALAFLADGALLLVGARMAPAARAFPAGDAARTA